MVDSKKETEIANHEKTELVAKDYTDALVLKLKEKEKFGLTFPKDYNYTNELMFAMLMLQETVDSNKKPVLQTCTKTSIQNTLLEMVNSGLSMKKRQCYPIAYGGKLQLLKSVYGNTCIARRYGLKNIDAQVIYKGDEFSYHIENARKVIDKHNQSFENIDISNIIGAYAVATMNDGSKHVEIMNISMIKHAWQQGYGYKENGNGTHQKFTDQMCMKTVKNRLLKQINNTYGSMEINDIDTEDIPSYDERLEADVSHDIETNANSEEFVSIENDIDEAISPEDVEVVDADVVDVPFK